MLGFFGNETSNSLQMKGLGGRRPSKILQTWTLWTLGYYFSGAWRSQTTAILLNIWRGWWRLLILFACLGNYFTVLNCRGWNYMLLKIFPWVSFLCIYMMFHGLPSTFTLFLKKAFCFTLCQQFCFNSFPFWNLQFLGIVEWWEKQIK